MTNILQLLTNNVAASRESAADFKLPHGMASVPASQSSADGNRQSDLDSGGSESNNPEIHSSSHPSAPLTDTLDHLELQLEHAQAMAQDSPDVFLKAAMNIASVDFFTVFNRFDTVTLSKRLEEKPELYFHLMNSQFSLMKARLEQQKFESKQKQAEARQRERDQKLRARKPILLTNNTLESVDRALTRRRRREEADAPASSIEHPASETSNTGPSQFVEFSVLDNTAALETPSSQITSADDAWHDQAEKHVRELVCSPS
jgi:hypothetical protein